MSNNQPEYAGISELKRYTSVEEINTNILKNCIVNANQIKTDGVYIFGVGKLGQRVFDFFIKKNIVVKGFIDNNTEKQKNKFNELQVFASNEISNNSIVYIASATYFNPIFCQLSSLGFKNLLSHMQAGILFFNDAEFPTEMYQDNLTQDLINNGNKYLEVFDLLDDQESKNVLSNLLLFRQTFQQKYINNIHTSIAKEYFDSSVLRLNSNETYFDIGGFDGDSAENFINFVEKKYTSVHIFEPDQDLINKAKNRLKNYSNVYYNPLGIYDKKTTLYFDITGGLDGIISNEGQLKIDTTTVDDYSVKANPTYIKYDVEGVEIEAINGSTNTIKNTKPKLAIASYHYPKHLWEIPLLIKKINPNYSIKLRHYTDSVFDSIFYFI